MNPRISTLYKRSQQRADALKGIDDSENLALNNLSSYPLCQPPTHNFRHSRGGKQERPNGGAWHKQDLRSAIGDDVFWLWLVIDHRQFREIAPRIYEIKPDLSAIRREINALQSSFDKKAKTFRYAGLLKYYLSFCKTPGADQAGETFEYFDGKRPQQRKLL